MRRWIMIGIVACGVCLAPASAWAVGVCLEASDACNDFFLQVQPEAGDIYRLHGYEYGCGSQTDLVSGTMRLDQGTAYIGLTGSSGTTFDTGAVYQRNYVIDTLSQSGTYEYLYLYLADGFIRYQGDSGSAILFVCPDPGGPVQEVGAPHEGVER